MINILINIIHRDLETEYYRELKPTIENSMGWLRKWQEKLEENLRIKICYKIMYGDCCWLDQLNSLDLCKNLSPKNYLIYIDNLAKASCSVTSAKWLIHSELFR